MPLSYSATRELLQKLEHSPRRFLGQNFLVDGNIVRKSLELAAIAPGDRVIEVGPGLGTLTRTLLEAGAELWAIEKDLTLFNYLKSELDSPRLHLTEGDAVEHPLAALPDDGMPFKIVANLPYAISTPWMDGVLGGPLPSRMVLMLQLEAAERYVAQPGSKTFGAISIFLQSAYETAPGHRVAGNCFYPKPDVDSYLLHLVRRATPYVFSSETKQLIRACFQQRRKQLGALLRGKLPDDGASWLRELEAAGLSAKSRPEQVSVALWQRLPAHLALS